MMLTSLIDQCAPEISPVTMTAIVRVESGGNPLAMWNNTTGQRILPTSRQQAIAYLQQAIAAGDRVDVGIAQVDTENFQQYGLSVKSAFNACSNLRVGGQILASDYFRAARRYGAGQVALFHAFEAYNSGKLIGDGVYSRKILAAAGIPVRLLPGGGIAFTTVRHFHVPFSYKWVDAPVTFPVDASYRGSSSGLGLTRKWG